VGPRHSPGRRGVKNGLNHFQNSNGSKTFIFPNFDRSKFGIPALQKFEIKYSFEDIKKMNNFIYRNFFKFERDLE
jgi:protein involved in ribonucleotide reduction